MFQVLTSKLLSQPFPIYPLNNLQTIYPFHLIDFTILRIFMGGGICEVIITLLIVFPKYIFWNRT